MLDDVSEDELALTAGVAGVDQRVDILALEEPRQDLQSRLGLLDRLQSELARNRGQVTECPLSALHFLFFGHADFEQMADRRRQHEVIVLEIFVFLGEPPQCPRDIGGNGRLLGNDQGFAHSDFQ